jgi:hypothetical protein
MTDQRAIAPTEDPVCGMTVDPAQADLPDDANFVSRPRGLAIRGA